MTCEHAKELRATWAEFDAYDERWCGELDPHSPHEGCLGIMCDYGCNAEDF